MKKLEDFTLKEYEEYNELVKNAGENDLFEIMELFGIKNPDKLEIKEFERLSSKIAAEVVSPRQLKEEYEINGKKYKLVTMIKDVKAAQFVDFQIYLKNYKIQNVLSIFLLPIEYRWSKIFKKSFKKVKDYNDGYDLVELQKDIYEHLTISDAITISDFFLNLSTTLLPIIHNSLMIQMAAEKEKSMRKRKKLQKNK